MKALKLALAGFTLAFLISGCLIVSQLQRPKVLDNGKGEIGVGTTWIYFLILIPALFSLFCSINELVRL